jgi:hypothetical protein
MRGPPRLFEALRGSRTSQGKRDEPFAPIGQDGWPAVRPRGGTIGDAMLRRPTRRFAPLHGDYLDRVDLID